MISLKYLITDILCAGARLDIMAASGELEDRAVSPILDDGLDDRSASPVEFLHGGVQTELDDTGAPVQKKISQVQLLASLDRMQISLDRLQMTLNKAKQWELEIGGELYNKKCKSFVEIDDNSPLGDRTVGIPTHGVDSHSPTVLVRTVSSATNTTTLGPDRGVSGSRNVGSLGNRSNTGTAYDILVTTVSEAPVPHAYSLPAYTMAASRHPRSVHVVTDFTGPKLYCDEANMARQSTVLEWVPNFVQQPRPSVFSPVPRYVHPTTSFSNVFESQRLQRAKYYDSGNVANVSVPQPRSSVRVAPTPYPYKYMESAVQTNRSHYEPFRAASVQHQQPWNVCEPVETGPHNTSKYLNSKSNENVPLGYPDVTQMRPRIPTASRQEYRHFADPPHFDSLSGETSTSSFKQKKPATYDGKSSWSDYFAQFEMTAILNNWDERRKALELATSLTGAARGVLSVLEVADRLNYSALVNKLSLRFEPQDLISVFQTQLRNRRRQHSEPIPELIHDIDRLTRKAFPTADEATRNHMAVSSFIEALNYEAQEMFVYQKDPQTIEEAGKAAMSFEAFHANKGRSEGVPSRMWDRLWSMMRVIHWVLTW